MKKLTLTLLSFLCLLLIIMAVFASASGNPQSENQQCNEPESKAGHYEMPKVLPASWIVGH